MPLKLCVLSLRSGCSLPRLLFHNVMLITMAIIHLAPAGTVPETTRDP